MIEMIVLLVLFAIGICLGIAGVLFTLFYAVTKLYLYVMNKRVAKARAVFSEYEQRTGHRRTHDVRVPEWDELFYCGRCGAFDCELLPQCPGRMLSYEQHEENSRHFTNQTGPWAPVQW